MFRNDTNRSAAEASTLVDRSETSKRVCEVRDSEGVCDMHIAERKRSALKILVLLAAAWCYAAPTFAVCTQHGSVTSSSTAIVGSNDVVGVEGRHYFMIQNTGTSNPMNVAVGSSNNATSNDLYLGPGASWVMTMQGLKMVPGGDVAAISASGTTYTFCDW
jgi:hypothetical protein